MFGACHVLANNEHGLSGLVGTKALIYLDDILIWGATIEEHNRRLVEVFDRYVPSH